MQPTCAQQQSGYLWYELYLKAKKTAQTLSVGQAAKSLGVELRKRRTTGDDNNVDTSANLRLERDSWSNEWWAIKWEFLYAADKSRRECEQPLECLSTWVLKLAPSKCVWMEILIYIKTCETKHDRVGASGEGHGICNTLKLIRNMRKKWLIKILLYLF